MFYSFKKPPRSDTPRAWFLHGVKGVFSIPAIILISSFIGFGALARELGWGLAETTLITATIWALPSQVVFIGSLAGGATLAATIIAVALSAVRLLPMTVALVPMMRDEKTPKIVLYLTSHFVAVTAWVVAMRFLPEMPRHARVPFFAGFGATLCLTNIAATAISHSLTGAMPPMLAAALFFLVPIYFLTSLTAAARFRGEVYALVLGLVLGPAFTYIIPQLDILVAGAIGGTLAYLAHRLTKRGAKPL